MGRCCCGAYKTNEPIVVNGRQHEPVGEGNFCGPVASHEMRDLRKENATLRVQLKELHPASPPMGPFTPEPVPNRFVGPFVRFFSHLRRQRKAKTCFSIAFQIAHLGQRNGSAQKHLDRAKDELYAAANALSSIGKAPK